MTYQLTPELAGTREAVSKIRATLWAIQRQDGVILRFTDYDEVIQFIAPGETTVKTYTPMGGADESALRDQEGVSESQQDVIGVLRGGQITSADLAAGLYDMADVFRYVIDPRFGFQQESFLSAHYYKLRDLSHDEHAWRGDLVSIKWLLSIAAGLPFQVACDNDLFDAGCQLIKADHARALNSVATVVNRGKFTANAITATANPSAPEPALSDRHFDNGQILWTSGAGVNRYSEIQDYVNSSRTFILRRPVPWDPQPTDQFTLWAGCSKMFEGGNGTPLGCKNFSNEINYSGVLYRPTDDDIRRPPRRFQ